MGSPSPLFTSSHARLITPLYLISGNTQTWHDHRPGETQVWNQPGWPPYQGKLTYGIPRPDVLKNGNARATIKVLRVGYLTGPTARGNSSLESPDLVILKRCITQTFNPCTIAAYYRTYGFFFCYFFGFPPAFNLISGITQVWHDRRPGKLKYGINKAGLYIWGNSHMESPRPR